MDKYECLECFLLHLSEPWKYLEICCYTRDGEKERVIINYWSAINAVGRMWLGKGEGLMWWGRLILILMPFNPRVKLKRRAPVLSRSKLGCVWDIDMKCNKKQPVIYHWSLSLREDGEGSWGLRRKNKDVTSLDAYLMSLDRFHLITKRISLWNFNVFPGGNFVDAKTSRCQ